ncbi:hypothetical protein [Pseudorhodoferax sp.]|uniref:hypothetical protein n=1 Tax=Pseudorhodoferax sp. TaxID=1993553 RepID=UPI0039E68D51
MDSTSGFGELTELDRVELHMLYGACVADIELSTRQQWWAGAYALAIYAMLLAGVQQFDDAVRAGNWHAWGLVAMTWAVCLYGVLAIRRMQKAITIGRRRLDRVRSSFGRPFQEVWAMPRPKEDIHRVLYCVMGFGAVLVTWMALDKAYAALPPLG